MRSPQGICFLPSQRRRHFPEDPAGAQRGKMSGKGTGIYHHTGSLNLPHSRFHNDPDVDTSTISILQVRKWRFEITGSGAGTGASRDSAWALIKWLQGALCTGLTRSQKMCLQRAGHPPESAGGTNLAWATALPSLKGPLLKASWCCSPQITGREWIRASFSLPPPHTTFSISVITGDRILAAGVLEKPQELGENWKQRPPSWLLKETTLPSILHTCCSYEVGKKREQYLLGFFNFDFISC